MNGPQAAITIAAFVICMMYLVMALDVNHENRWPR